MIDARRMECYTAFYANTAVDGQRTSVSELRGTQADIIAEGIYDDYLDRGPVTFIGDGAPKCFPLLSSHPNARLDAAFAISAAGLDGLYFWKNGTYTRFNVSDIIFGNNEITVGDKTFSVNDVDSITFKKPAETGEVVTDTLYVSYYGQSATVSPEIVSGITVDIKGAAVNITNANEDREMTFVLISRQTFCPALTVRLTSEIVLSSLPG